MTDLRTAAQQALEYMKLVGQMDMYPEEWAIVERLEAALAEPCPCGDRSAAECPGEWEPGCDLGNNPKYAKRVNLAEPVQEPVAWMHTDPDKPRVKFLEWREDEPGYRGRWIKTPLYTAPPRRKPLTEEEIEAAWMQKPRWHAPPIGTTDIEFARAIERAHGIE